MIELTERKESIDTDNNPTTVKSNVEERHRETFLSAADDV